jgi:type IV pilus assembly protein PilB
VRRNRERSVANEAVETDPSEDDTTTEAADARPFIVPEKPQHSGTPLGKLLVGKGALSEDQLADALTAQTTTGHRLGDVLVELGLISGRELAGAVAEQAGLETVDLSRTELDPEVVALLPEQIAWELRAVPIRRDGNRIDVAVGDPLRGDLVERLIDAVHAPVRLLVATPAEVEQATVQAYAPTAEITDALRQFEEDTAAKRLLPEAAQPRVVVDENAPVVKVVNLILEHAVRDRASDVHIEPQQSRVRVRVRTDGVLHEILSLPAAMGPSLLSRIKVMADMNIVERRRSQDGQMEVTISGKRLDIRVSTSATVLGEKCVLRLLDTTRPFLGLPELGMPEETFPAFQELIRSPFGMVICAGPTGSGKTTTLYATMSAIANDSINVMTIEDPVEYLFPAINQIQIHEQAGITFANGLRSILRQDPDAILVGEIRDVETARIAVQAALTGHLVMSSLHATDAAAALQRFMDMGIESFLVASSLLGVVGQRLVRRICPHCVTSYELTADERTFYERFGGEPDKTEFVHGAGCNFCGQTGYFGRVGVYEVLCVTDDIRRLVVENATREELRQVAVDQGMKTLRDQAVRLIAEDKTTVAEVLRTVYVL